MLFARSFVLTPTGIYTADGQSLVSFPLPLIDEVDDNVTYRKTYANLVRG